MQGIKESNTILRCSHHRSVFSEERALSIKKWETLLKAVELGSLSKAADELGYTQSGITHMMNSLEADVGFSLLERRWDGVHLTAEGEELLPDIQNLIRADAQLCQHLENIGAEKEDHLSIGTYASMSIQWLPAVLTELRREMPHVEIDLHVGWYGEMVGWLEQGSVDLILCEKCERPDFIWIPLYNDPLLAILPEAHPAAKDPVFSPEHLNGQPLLYESGCLLAKKIIKTFGYASKQLSITSEDETVIISMVRQGVGCGILPELCIRDQTAGLAVQPLKTPIYRTLGVLRKKGSAVSFAEQHLLSLLRRHIQQQTHILQ